MKKNVPLLYQDRWIVTYFASRALYTRLLYRGWADATGFPLLGTKVILTPDICNHKKKAIYNCVVQMKVGGKFNLLLYKSNDGCLWWGKKRKSICELWHRTTFKKHNNVLNLQAVAAHANDPGRLPLD